MTRDEWARVEQLFDQGRERPAETRDAWLTEVCDDATTRSLVADMLAAYDADPDFLEASTDVAGAVAFAVADGVVGQRLGPYRIVAQLGRGGMGVVYEAVRDDADYERRVAIKILPSWSGSKLAERFRRERRLLAALDHPGIARLIDSGTTPDGAPYFVMELVDGQPIDVWCREQRLDVRQRVALVERVADAVAYAHQHLVVHRDVKPANILVQADGQPKLLDFGIATLLSDHGDAAPGVTRTGHQSFTPEFASPEQIRGEPVTTASDVYSLGVLLYLLLAGRRPYDVHVLSPLEAMRTVCEVDPPPPSAVAGADGATLRGDLDAAVGKALRKAPHDRYPTMAAFTADLGAWRLGLPVSAAPESSARRAWRFARRNKAAAAVLVALLIGGGVAAWQAGVAARERDRADARFNDVRKLANAVVGPLYDEIAKVPGSTEARRALVKEALAYLDGLEAQAAADLDLKAELAEAYQKIGDVQGNLFYQNLGDLAGAKASYAKLQRLREAVYAARPSDTAARLGRAHAEVRLGDAALADNRANDSVANYERALALVDGVQETSESRVLTESRVRGNMGVALNMAGRQTEAEAQFTKNIALIEPWASRPGASETMRRSLMSNHANLVDVLHLQGRDTDALPHAEIALAAARQLEKDGSDVATARRSVYQVANRMAAVLDGLNRIDEAIAVWMEAIETLKQLSAFDSKNVRLQFDLAAMYQGLAEFHMKKKRVGPAWDAITTSLDTWKAAFAASPDAKNELFNYGGAFAVLSDVEQGRGHLQASAEALRRVIAIYSDPAIDARSRVDRFDFYEALGDVLLAQARARSSEELVREARAAYTTARDGYAALADAHQLPTSHDSKVDAVTKKLRKTAGRRQRRRRPE